MTETALHLKDADVRGFGHVQWAEYNFRAKHIKGYWIAIAAVVIPAQGGTFARICWGASACAPADAHLFDRTHAANRALGRAKQVATWSLRATKPPRHVRHEFDRTGMTLLGPVAMAIEEYREQAFPDLQARAELLASAAAGRAMIAAVKHDFDILVRKYPDFDFEMRVPF